MSLRDVTEAYNKKGGEYFCNNCFHANVFNKKFKEQVIQEYSSHNSHPIAKKLDLAFHFGGGECYIFCQHKTGAESNWKNNKESCNMRTYGYNSQIHNLA